MYIKANAKINVFLDVVSVRKDGYHNLNMIMLPLELHDTIEIEKAPYSQTTFVVNDRVYKEETSFDLIRKTISSLEDNHNLEDRFNISVHKEIPICAGLGGGSCNAAATYKAIKKLSKIQMDEDKELNFCLSLGADVPFCMANVPAHVEGIGEKVTPIKLASKYYVLIIQPDKGLSTEKVFKASNSKKMKHGNVDQVIKALAEDNEELLAKAMMNSLEETSIELVPEIKEIKEMFIKDGFKCAMMTGSGSCVFALTKDRRFARAKYNKYLKAGYNAILTRTL